MTFEEQKQAARERVRAMNKLDGSDVHDLWTILTALDAGLRFPENGAQYDALVMLEDLTGFVKDTK